MKADDDEFFRGLLGYVKNCKTQGFIHIYPVIQKSLFMHILSLNTDLKINQIGDFEFVLKNGLICFL